jgi:hypothetical protein
MFYICRLQPVHPKVSGIKQTLREIQRKMVLYGEYSRGDNVDSALYHRDLSFRPQNILDIAHFHVYSGQELL